MAAPRFYTPGAVFTEGAEVALTQEARHHAGRVLRMVAGDDAVLFDGRGSEAVGPISFEGSGAFITVREVSAPAVESPVAITLVQAMVSPEKTDWIVEKAVETGVVRIVIVPAKRCVTKLSGDRLAKRLQHWQDVAVGACEQCGRDVVPEVSVMKFAEALETVEAEERFILAPGSNKKPRLSGIGSVAFAVGPEGGFDESEIAQAEEAGWKNALIGPRVLRTETAGMVAAALANAAAGDYLFE